MAHHVIENGFSLIKLGLEKEAKRFGAHAVRHRIAALQKMLLQLEGKYAAQDVQEQLDKSKGGEVAYIHFPQQEDE